MNQIKLFEGHEVEVLFNVNVDGKIHDALFNAKHVGEVLNLSNVREQARKMNDNQVVKLTNSAVRDTDIRKINNAGENFFTVSGIFKLTFRSDKEEAVKFTNWVTDDVLPSVYKTGRYELNKPKVNQEIETKFKMTLTGVEFSRELLRLDTTSTIKMLEGAHKAYGLPTDHLPSYVEEEVTKSLTTLLKENDIKLSPAKANTKLIELGILEIKERPSSKGGTKEFKSLTEKGLNYGKNLLSPRNNKETQPHYYESRFEELLKLLTK